MGSSKVYPYYDSIERIRLMQNHMKSALTYGYSVYKVSNIRSVPITYSSPVNPVASCFSSTPISPGQYHSPQKSCFPKQQTPLKKPWHNFQPQNKMLDHKMDHFSKFSGQKLEPRVTLDLNHIYGTPGSRPNSTIYSSHSSGGTVDIATPLTPKHDESVCEIAQYPTKCDQTRVFGIAGSAYQAQPRRSIRLAQTNQKYEVRGSQIHNLGLYATQTIPKNEFIMEYRGEIITHTEADKREEYYEKTGMESCYMFRLDENYIVDGTIHGNDARLMNHSCMPTCVTRIVVKKGVKHIHIYSLRDIEPGDELTYDYMFEPGVGGERLVCLCGAPNCRGYLD